MTAALMNVAAAVLILTSLVANALEVDLARAERRRLAREAAARRAARNPFRNIIAALRTAGDAFRGLGAQITRSMRPPDPEPHRWYRRGEPPCVCEACR